jgi:2-desacetyl-2-hydroxyethyl bacteriochlorophyllide A dehydrogenase
MKTIALLATAVDRVEVVEVVVPDPAPGQVIIEAAYTAISPGTEMRCLAGKQPGIVFPFIPGYSMVGRIAARGAGVTLAEGTLVFCQGTEKADRPLTWGAHIAHALRGEDSLFPLPAGVDPLEASLAKLGAIAYRGVRVAGTRPHEEVAVVGLGPIGQLAARLHRLAGARVVAADLSADRVALARAAGIEAVVPGEGLAAAFRSLQPGGADVVVDSTGAPPVLQQSVLLAKPKPWDNSLTEPTRLVIQGSYPENVVFDYHQAFYRELSVHFPRDNQARDLHAVLRFLASGSLKTRDLISELCPPGDAQRIYSALRAAKPGLLTAAFQWR